MDIQRWETKDGCETLEVNKILFHSKYAAIKEAQRFCESCQTSFNPSLIILIEPAFAYTAKFLKEKFPQAQIAAVRLLDYDFSNCPDLDFDIKYNKDFKNTLINNFGEEKLLSSAIFIWTPSKTLFPQEINEILADYKTALLEAKTLLVTRQFFEKKWLLNSCNFITFAKNLICLKESLDLPLIICASGPSLIPCIKLLKENQNKVFILALSSALCPLLDNEIIPDLVLSTDGGFWAGQHLKTLAFHKELPLACSCESFIPKKILSSNPILALEYNDSSSFISSSILQKAGILTFPALRNPTVSGTALYFASQITRGKLYFCGLDLGFQKGFQHTEPNELEKNAGINDFRIKNKSTRLCASSFNGESLKIYKDWFTGINDISLTQRTFRIIDKKYRQNSLGQIKDIESPEFSKLLKSLKPVDKKDFFTEEKKSKKAGKEKSIKETFDFILSEIECQKWQKQIFPADFITKQISGNENSAAVEKRLKEKLEALKNKIRKLKDAAE